MEHSIDRLKRAAKALRKGFMAGEAEVALRVWAVLPEVTALSHADALHVVAREAGYDSWPKLKFAHEQWGMGRAEKADRLKQALFHGQHWVVTALLEEAADLGRDNFGLACALYDVDHVGTVLARDPGVATRIVGVRRPILHLAFSRHLHGGGDSAAMMQVARLLLEHGADVNDSYPFNQGETHELSALYGALGHGGNMVLARWLLENGANPDDNESLYHATELGHHDGIRLMFEFGARIEGTNALFRMLDFDDPEGLRLFLEAGADVKAQIVTHPSGEPDYCAPALHHAARRRCQPEIARMLIEAGADGTGRFHGHTAYALARIYGNSGFAEVLERAGQASALSRTEAIFAAAAEGRVEGQVAEAEMSHEQRLMLTRIMPYDGVIQQAKALIGIGISPDWREEMGIPAIHMAGWEGQADLVEWLLGFGPDLSMKNTYGGDLMGTILHGAENCEPGVPGSYGRGNGRAARRGAAASP